MDAFDDFRFWRMTEGWSYTETTRNRKPPTDRTVNSEIALINEWFNNHLLPKGYVRRKPAIKSRKLVVDELASSSTTSFLDLIAGLRRTYPFGSRWLLNHSLIRAISLFTVLSVGGLRFRVVSV